MTTTISLELVFLRYKINEKVATSLADRFKNLVQSFFGLSATFINELAYIYIYILDLASIYFQAMFLTIC